MSLNVSIRRIGEHRGAPRLYIDSVSLERFGFTPGSRFNVSVDRARNAVSIEVANDGCRRVSSKTRGNGRTVPVIDLNSAEDLRLHAPGVMVRVVLSRGRLFVLALASTMKADERLHRLKQRHTQGLGLRVASIAFGAGVTASALHVGLSEAGITTDLAALDEISPEFVEVALENNPLIRDSTIVLNVPMQEAIADDWVLGRIGQVEVLELGIPCSGASRAGVTKCGLKKMEDHPHVGHLVAAVIQWIARLQPAIVVAENVVGYRDSASAAILRKWLCDAGYSVTECVLDARDFGSLEARVRWFLTAHPPAVAIDIEALAPEAGAERPQLRSVLQEVPLDDPSYRAVSYLHQKEARDAVAGKGFRMQLLDEGATEVPTLRKGYHKGGSTDPRVRHPQRPELSRLLTPVEHARVKGISETLIKGVSATMAHQICGQSVDTRPVRSLGRVIGEAIREACRTGGTSPRSGSIQRKAVG